MRKFREVASTIADLAVSEGPESPDAGLQLNQPSQNRLSGGATMWQARLVLSTLEPKGPWASRLRTAIRRGDEQLADQLLDDIYSRNSAPSGAEHPTSATLSGTVSRTKTTVLPPAPTRGQRAAS